MKPTETKVVPTDAEVPSYDKVIDSVKPVFNEQGHLDGVKVDNTTVPLTPIPENKIIIVPVTPSDDAPSVSSPALDSVYVVKDGGAKNPEAYIVHN